MNSSQPQANIFFQPNSLGALPSLWLQAKLTISLTSIQDKFARLFMSIAAELWLRDAIDTVEEVFRQVARNFTLRLAEKLAQYICSLTRRAESLAFFSSSLADVALWLGPYMSISSQTSFVQDQKGPELQANHNKPKTTQTGKTTRKSPSQICVSSKRKNSKPDTQRGNSPNKNTHKKDLPRDTVV